MIKYFSFFLVFIFIIQPSYAGSIHEIGLKNLFDEFHYSLNVEWDQEDKNFYNQIEDKFQKGLEELRNKGMTQEELINFTSHQFKDAKMKSDFEHLTLQLKVNHLSPG